MSIPSQFKNIRASIIRYRKEKQTSMHTTTAVNVYLSPPSKALRAAPQRNGNKIHLFSLQVQEKICIGTRRRRKNNAAYWAMELLLSLNDHTAKLGWENIARKLLILIYRDNYCINNFYIV